MDHNTVEAYKIVRRLDHTGKIDDSRHGKKQKAATALLRDEFQKQDIAKPVSLRLQSSWASQSFLHCTVCTLNESCVTCFSPWAHCWFLTHPLQWASHGTKISR